MAAASPLASCPRCVRAVFFDTDGVITDSARRRAAAWKKAFDAFEAFDACGADVVVSDPEDLLTAGGGG